MAEEKPQFQVRERRVEIDVSDKKDKLTYVHPAFGPTTYENLREIIIEADLKPFSMKDASLILFSAFENSEKKYADEPGKIMSSNIFYVFNKSLWTPNGVYVIADDGKEPLILEQGKLEKAVYKEKATNIQYSKDEKIRFVPKEYIKLGQQSSLDLAKNKYVIALAGEEGAERLARVSEKYSKNPYVFGLENITTPDERRSVLDSGWCQLRLGILSYNPGGGSFAFGVKK